MSIHSSNHPSIWVRVSVSVMCVATPKYGHLKIAIKNVSVSVVKEK